MSDSFLPYCLFLVLTHLVGCDSLFLVPILSPPPPPFPRFSCARQGSFIYCLLLLVFTILAFNHLYLIWVSLPTTTDLSIVQSPPLTCADCATLHHQTKRTILFISLPWHPFFATVWVPSLSLSLMACT